MIRKILAAIFSLSMVLTAAPVVQAEEPVQEIASADNLINLFKSGGSGKLMNNIDVTSESNISVSNDTSIDMNGNNIIGAKFTISDSVKLNLTGSGSINAKSGIEPLNKGQIHADNTVNFNCELERTSITLSYNNLLNGGTYTDFTIQIYSNKDNPAIIENGVFNSSIVTQNAATGIVINGGTFNRTIRSNETTEGTITINGGTFNSDVSNSTINGGTFNSGTIRNSIIYGGTFNGCTIDYTTCTVIKKINNLSISDIPAQTYSGADLTPAVTIKDGENELVQSQDYTVTYSDNRNVGTGKIAITGKGKYYGTVEKTFTILPQQIVLSGITVNDKIYDGTDKAVVNTDSAVLNGKAEGDDLTVDASGVFADPDAGSNKTVNLTLTLKGSAAGNYALAYGNQQTATASITKADPALSVEAVATKTYSDNDFQFNVLHKGDGQVTYSSDKPDVLSVSGTGLAHIVSAGTANITVNLADSKNYKSASDTLHITVDKANGNISIQNAVINKTYGDADFSIKPSDSTPGTISYRADGSGVVSVDGDGNVHINKPGTAVVTISMDATGNHHAVSETITVNVAVAPSVTPQVNNYVITTGNKNNWQRGSNKQLLIISDGDYDLFNGLYVDGSLVDRKNYDVKKGSTEVYLNSSYLETLSAGKHTFELRYSNGKNASGEFTIIEAVKTNKKPAPNTGVMTLTV